MTKEQLEAKYDPVAEVIEWAYEAPDPVPLGESAGVDWDEKYHAWFTEMDSRLFNWRNHQSPWREDRADDLPSSRAEVDRLTSENERLRESWLDSQCAGKITTQTVRDCIGSGNCTCEARSALEQKP